MAKKSNKMSFNMSRIRLNKVLLSLTFVISFSFLSSNIYADSTSTGGAAADPAMVSKGKQLFEDNCKSCHAVHKKVIGPALKDVETRVDRAWLHKWIRNSSALVASGDAYAVKIKKEYNNADMTAFGSFKDEDINAILDYIKAESAIAPAEAAGPAKDSKDGATSTEGGNNYTGIILGLVIAVLVLVLITLVIFLTVVKRYLKDRENTLDEEDKELVNQKFDVMAVVKSKMFITVVSLIFIAVVVKACWVGMISIGVEQNYAPKQPIPFPHDVHAGQYKINCNYCHTGAMKGKQANIPAMNICWNCHNKDGIKSGSKYGEDVLKQVIEAKGPIRWVRVHNLPDLAYFNHSQHTVAGGLECQQCHGPIEEMDVVRQHSPLTMGWCISCHRGEVKNIRTGEFIKVNEGKDSKYYDWLLEEHAKQKKNYKPGDKIEATEGELGGLECAKCHY